MNYRTNSPLEIHIYLPINMREVFKEGFKEGFYEGRTKEGLRQREK
jgi:hypothetical protein